MRPIACFGLLGPTGVPQAILSKLHAEIAKACSDPPCKSAWLRLAAKSCATRQPSLPLFWPRISRVGATWQKKGNIRPDPVKRCLPLLVHGQCNVVSQQRFELSDGAVGVVNTGLPAAAARRPPARAREIYVSAIASQSAKR